MICWRSAANGCAATVNTKKPETSGDWPVTAEPVYRNIALALSVQPRKAIPSLVVGYSGGLDSHVLLVAARRWCKQTGSRLRAIYIDHGLQQQSADWAVHCRAVCQRLAISYESVRVTVELDSGQSPEHAARDARYRALEQLVASDEWLLTAHHADDQAETVLLQLLRGAGVAGLAAMPESKAFGAGVHLRPLLNVTRAQLEAAATALRLRWIEDHSNADTRFDRNFLRHRVLPVISERWPGAVTALVRSAGHAAEASTLLQALASQDIALTDNRLAISSLLALSTERQSNALRQWIVSHGYPAPSTVKLQRLREDLLLAADDTHGCVSFGNVQVRRHRHHLYLGPVGTFELCEPFCHVWRSRLQPLYIPQTGQTLTAEVMPLKNIPPDEPLMVRSRQGGERIQLSTQRHHQSVKSLLQQQGLPPWQRCRLPFIWRGDQLLGIVGVGFIDPLSTEN